MAPVPMVHLVFTTCSLSGFGSSSYKMGKVPQSLVELCRALLRTNSYTFLCVPSRDFLPEQGEDDACVATPLTYAFRCGAHRYT